MKAKVGYSVDVLRTFAMSMDNMLELKEVSKMKARGSFYKIMLGEKADLIMFARETVSVLLSLTLAFRYNESKMYGKTFPEIVSKKIIPELNRGLYNQESVQFALKTDAPEERIHILGAEAITKDKPEKAIALLMILVGLDLEELLLDGAEVQRIFREKHLLSKTFISMEDIKK
jgi:hypothetical protein